MTSTERVWITSRARTRLQTELHQLLAQRNIVVPDAASDAYAQSTALRAALQARIHHIQELLGNALVGEDPPDDGIAEPGMVLTVHDDDIGDTETFLLGVPDAADGAIEVYSMQSPLGTAIAGAQPGDQRTYRAPSGATISVTLLHAVPYGRHRPRSLVER